ncbi:FAD-binding protein [Rubrobacter taiwanensis]|uniref:FAD-binding protein n=1 Tax=Rubrobacter taiwanensis TaxID=185139 RepID=A0A4R1BAD9_9ACTN|nr:GMC family oxidoreductase N-terminal domain-containing protein [Rubrobacter taiwanensis]TCJ13878.1 FAD-binding protein [Rubrobacter taiwanensis]
MVLTLSGGARRALDSICDTFVPGGEGLPSATERGVPEAMIAAVGANPSAAERERFAALLEDWDTRLAGSGQASFSSLPRAERERTLLRFADAPDVQSRAVFQALRKGVLLSYYCLPHEGERPNPVYEALGYPGPLGPPEDPPPKTVKPFEVSADTELECDVCVVGSGAGGGTAAGVLVAAGLDVIIIEAGGYYSEEDFDGEELSGYARLYLNGGSIATEDQSIGLLAGSCLGGGTVVNYTWCFRPPDFVREEWRERFGLSDWAGRDFDESLDAVWERLSISAESSIPSKRDELMRRGLKALGWHSEVMQRNCRGCREEVCRLCHYGCQIGAKQSTLKTWLQDAYDGGARILVRTPVDRVLIEGGRARGVEARTADGHRVTVRARVVALAAGAIHTPAIMVRSGMNSPAIGKNLMLHPVLITWGIFDEEVNPWEGTLGATYSDEHLNLGQGYGVKYEQAATPPGILAIFAPWRGSRESAELMQALRYTAGYGALQRAREGGEIAVGRDGLPVARWALSDFDREVMRRGLDGAAQILEAGGARRIYSSHAGWVSYEPGRGGRERLLAAADRCGWGPAQVTLGSFHLMGTARMGNSREDSVCDATGQTWEVKNLYVVDGAVLPTGLGVNPMVTIEAAAHRIARGIAGRMV